MNAGEIAQLAFLLLIFGVGFLWTVNIFFQEPIARLVARSREHLHQYPVFRLHFPGRGDAVWERLGTIEASDPAFDREAFLCKVEGGFHKVQAAWSAQDLESVRGFLSDGVFSRFLTYLELDRLQGQRNQVSDVRVLKRGIVDARVDNDFQSITVGIYASVVDVTVSASKGVLRSGSKEPVRFVEHWTFLRRPGVESREDGFGEPNCPNCGAALAEGQVARCEHCGALINSGAYDWVLAEITQEGAEPPNDSALRSVSMHTLAIDDSVSIQALEDRASVIFWSLIDASFRGDISVAQRLLTPELLENYRPGYEAEKRRTVIDVGVGAVWTETLRADGALRASVAVRWECKRLISGHNLGQVQRTSRLLLVKSPGGDAARRGLASAGCGQCGGPLERTGQARCPWCGHDFSPVATDWLLDSADLRDLGAIPGDE